MAGHEFEIGRRGYDQTAVRRFLADVAQQLRVLRTRESELQSRLAEAEQRAAAPIDEETLSAAVGAETARILQVAHAAGAEVIAKAETRGATIASEAESEAREIRNRAESEAAAIIGDARRSAATAVEAAKGEGRAILEEARELRRRVLGDLSDRRRLLTAQIEQLRAGKETLSTAVSRVAETIAEVQSNLHGSEEEARVAAEAVRRRLDFEHVPARDEREEEGAAEVVSAPAVEKESEKAPREVLVAPSELETPALDVDAEGHDSGRVDELFAKLKASTTTGETAPSHSSPRRRVGAEEGPASGQSEPLAASAVTQSEPPISERSVALLRRDELLGTAGEEVVHALKRALRVEQNELLDRLRSLGRGKDPLGALDSDATTKNLTSATTSGLVAAFSAGVAFARERLDGQREAQVPKETDAVTAHATAEGVAEDLGGEISIAIGRRLEDALKGAGESGSLQSAVGAAYREWKGDRLERAASDHVTSAFAQGVLYAAKASGSPVMWIFDDEAAHCPDCEDDELAGAVVAGAPFPTGQVHPPAHGGCRCVISPVRP